MLVLRRKPGEEIMVGHDVKITITSIKGGKVFLGFEASPEIPVHRREVYDAIYRPSNQQDVETESHRSAPSVNGKDADTEVIDTDLGGTFSGLASE